MAKRLIYSVHHAITSFSDGYAIRGHGLAKAVKEAGIKLWVLVSATDLNVKLPFRINIDGVNYLHLDNQKSEAYYEFLKVFKPCAVLAASNWRHAKPIQQAAQQLEIPFWYEARGFWELSECARDPGFAASKEYREELAGETAIAQASERLFTLNRQMAAEWINRGIPAAKISLIPNGIGHIPKPMPEANQALLSQLGLKGSKVIGYIGSFSVYEGLEDLIRSFALARQQGLEARLLLVGSLTQGGNKSESCQSSDYLRNLAYELGIADQIVFTGRVAPEMISNYYPLIDLMVIPRRPELVCEIVSPIKPLEAASHGIQLLLSSVAPLADLQALGPGVHLFDKGSVDSLARQLVAIISRPTPSRSPHTLYPGLEKFLWSRNIEPLLEALRDTSPNLRRSFE
jgi:glycosyltransferase involved in cell wall biosynthesis